MEKFQAYQNALLVESFLVKVAAKSFISKEINVYDIRVHFFSSYYDNKEVLEIADAAQMLILSDCEFVYDNSTIHGHDTFDIVWPIEMDLI